MAIFSTRYLPSPFSSSSPPKAFVSKSCSLSTGSMKTGPLPLNQYPPNLSTNLSSSDVINRPTRRSGNYEPTKWDYEYIQSTHNDYAGKKYMKQFDELKAEMKKNLMLIMVEGSQELEKLELIDNLERLGGANCKASYSASCSLKARLEEEINGNFSRFNK